MTEEQVFLAALDLPDGTARAAYLDKACGGDAQVRRQVEALLAAHFRSGEFLDVPVAQQVKPDSRHDDTLTVDGDAMSAKNNREDESEDLAFLTPSTHPDSLGRIGHYEVLQVLGKGGFGIVFRAFDDMLQRVVAVKVMAPQMAATSPARRRFLREARTSAQVRHENVVQVYEVAEQPLPYLAMEFIPGETLQQKLNRSGPLDVPEVLRIGRQIAEGLAAAHASDLIHRDIKPGNILLEGGSQKAKITDFGLARAADDASISQSGIIAGTPMFMAPEQALGHKIDQRADLFSLGSVLYQMTSGRPPFRAPSALAVLKRVAEEPPRPIPEIIPETPAWLCGIIAKLHAKNPDDRFQSAREVADLLADCEAKLKAKQKVKNVLPATRKPARRKWVAAAAVLLLSAIALAVTEFAGVTHLFRQQATTDPIKPGGGLPPSIEIATKEITKKEPPPITSAKKEAPASSPGQEPAQLAPFAYFRFDGNDKNEGTGVAKFQLRHTEFKDNALYLNGKYEVDEDGYRAVCQTPNLDYSTFTVAIRFKAEDFGRLKSNLLTAGTSHRWFGMLRSNAGNLGIFMNLYSKNYFYHEIKGATLDKGKWTLVACAIDLPKRKILAYLNGKKAEEIELPEHFQLDITNSPEPNIHKDWSFTNYSNGDVFHGLIDRLLIYNRALSPQQLEKIECAKEPLPPTFKNGIGMEFVIVPKGKSWLGGGKDKLGDKEVEIPADFYLGKYEVTQEEWEKVMGENPSHFSRTGGGKDAVKDIPEADLKRFPVEKVSWDQCQIFVTKLNQREKESGWVYRLPTEAEWEYACRGGPMADKLDSAFDFYFAKPTNTLLPEQANFHHGLNRTCKVGSYEANRMGLFDMHGNVCEWCDNTEKAADGASLRVARAGSWVNDSGALRAASRYVLPAQLRDTYVGLRLARVPACTAPPEAKTLPPAIAPFTDADVKRIAALPAAEQVEEVRKELMRRNPGFDGKVTPTVENDVVTGLRFLTDEVVNIAPVRALKGLTSLDCRSTQDNEKLSDFSPLQGMPLTALNLRRCTQIKDLTPLKDMPLTALTLSHCQVRNLESLQGMPLISLYLDGCEQIQDLRPLKGMPLVNLRLNDNTNIKDLEPLRGIPLKGIHIQYTTVTDLSPLKGMQLEDLRLTPKRITQGLDILRDMKSLKTIGISWEADKAWPAAEFWERYDKGEFTK